MSSADGGPPVDASARRILDAADIAETRRLVHDSALTDDLRDHLLEFIGKGEDLLRYHDQMIANWKLR